jgi:hypothetical protein
MEHHLALEVDINMARGMSPQEARRAAHLKFGSQQQVSEALGKSNSIAQVEKAIRDI